MNYAKIWRRVVAKLIDACIVGTIYPLLSVFVMLGFYYGKLQRHITSNEEMMNLIWAMITIQIVAAACYSTVLTAKNGATLGKRIMKIRVITTSGNKISILKAFVRFIAELTSALLFMAGHTMAFFDKERRTFHDRMSKTIVVNLD